MKRKTYISMICIFALSFIAASCSTENIDSPDNTQNPGDSNVDSSDDTQNPEDSNKEGYYISLSAEIEENKSRAHWDIDASNSLSYAWDASTDEMKSFVKRGDGLVSFIGDKLYSPTTVTPDGTIKTKTSLEITTGLSENYKDGDIIWAVSPVDDTHIQTAGSSASVEFTLPNEYVQTAISTTEHLKPYLFMTGSGTVNNNTANLNFKVLPAVYRFKITNYDADAFTLSEVGITGPFNNKVVVGVDGTPVYSASSENYTIKVKGENIDIKGGETAYMYAMVFPTETSKKTDPVTIYINGAYGDLPVEFSTTAACNDIHGGKDLESNKYYDMPVPVKKQVAISIYDNSVEDWKDVPSRNDITMEGFTDIKTVATNDYIYVYLEIPTETLNGAGIFNFDIDMDYNYETGFVDYNNFPNNGKSGADVCREQAGGYVWGWREEQQCVGWDWLGDGTLLAYGPDVVIGDKTYKEWRISLIEAKQFLSGNSALDMGLEEKFATEMNKEKVRVFIWIRGGSNWEWVAAAPQRGLEPFDIKIGEYVNTKEE